MGTKTEPGDLPQKRLPSRPTTNEGEVRTATLLASNQPRAIDERHEPRRGGDRLEDRTDWPSVRDILAMHRPVSRAIRASAAAARVARLASSPTQPREPATWTLPTALAGPPLFICVLALLAALCSLSWAWASDSYSASILADRLMTAGSGVHRRSLPVSIMPPTGNWMFSTAQHLADWAIYLSRLDPQERERFSLDERALLSRALEASPLNATARLALAQLRQKEPNSSSPVLDLGLSRDTLTLTYSASRLAARGKQAAALDLYRQAIKIVSSTRPPLGALPRFNDDPGAPRYLLPGEDKLREVLRDLVSKNEWSVKEWSNSLPPDSLVALAAARLLREQGRAEAEMLLEMIMNAHGSPETAESPSPYLLAARAEALAMRSRWREAEMQYRQAIELMEDMTIKRSWWFNLADVASRLDDEGQQQAALRAALEVTTTDDISRRAAELRRGPSQRSRMHSRGERAN
jgi:hypothetical protein